MRLQCGLKRTHHLPEMVLLERAKKIKRPCLVLTNGVAFLTARETLIGHRGVEGIIGRPRLADSRYLCEQSFADGVDFLKGIPPQRGLPCSGPHHRLWLPSSHDSYYSGSFDSPGVWNATVEEMELKVAVSVKLEQFAPHDCMWCIKARADGFVKADSGFIACMFVCSNMPLRHWSILSSYYSFAAVDQIIHNHCGTRKKAPFALEVSVPYPCAAGGEQ